MDWEHYPVQNVWLLDDLLWKHISRARTVSYEGIGWAINANPEIYGSIRRFSRDFGRENQWLQFDAHSRPFFVDVEFNILGTSLCCSSRLPRLPANYPDTDCSDDNASPFRGCVPAWRAIVGLGCMIGACIWLVLTRDRCVLLCIGGFSALLFGRIGIWLLGKHHPCNQAQDRHSGSGLYCGLHSDKLYHKKSLTDSTFCNTFNGMANVLNADKQTAIIASLAEGSSIRSIERITGVHRDTVMRLGVKVGNGCELLLDSKMQDLDCHYLQFDELWGFIGKKERHVGIDDDPEMGDVWTFCAIDSETKLVPSFLCGKRNHATANAFVQDVASRMRNRVQISADGPNAYVEAVEQGFGGDVDYGQIVKVYTHDGGQHPERKYSARLSHLPYVVLSLAIQSASSSPPAM